jgi:hypothetical protein
MTPNWSRGIPECVPGPSAASGIWYLLARGAEVVSVTTRGAEGGAVGLDSHFAKGGATAEAEHRV